MPRRVVYVTSNEHKKRENEAYAANCVLSNGDLVSSHFRFEFRTARAPVVESLEVDLATLVRGEVSQAYSRLRVPCVVEHAGLIFEDYLDQSYPGGLTKAMWNALRERFVEETHSAGRRAVARAVVGFCDGKAIHVFTGETWGRIATSPRGNREFYWDTVFEPDTDDPEARGLTYSEIATSDRLGLVYKMKCLSQSSIAMTQLLEHILADPRQGLWAPE